ncbi:MAG TPA: glutaredoxin 3 [Geminicoccus sp.]|jgi:glutaredoxin 3|uniref:glutaredoxin 3 n=1 Tax=Geminicoccus sp. TaxID=2024832 RepID=UPI002E33378D|nr:glutaredoxin 3 [Geminicoccus sp.]HEX2529328.1 glutaredoxin 3 [Geminicoccus sp.]
MPKIEIYTTPICPYCIRAKRLLDRKGVAYDEIDLWSDPGRRTEMLSRAAGRTTVPQIFIDGRGIGGSDDLHALDAAGRLDGMLLAGEDGSASSARSASRA